MTAPLKFTEAALDRIELSDSGCWFWVAPLDRWGYGKWGSSSQGQTLAHRWAYETWVGPIPFGLVIDHLCHDPVKCLGGVTCTHRRCVNPGHLSAVTKRENDARSVHAAMTHCKSGHEFTKDNTYITPRGARQCRTCNREAVARYKARRAVQP